MQPGKIGYGLLGLIYYLGRYSLSGYDNIMIIAFTGAGISAASGIPTFTERPWIRDKLSRDFANEHPEEYREIMRQFVQADEDANPNDAHMALAVHNIPVITMNIDSLHQRAKKRCGSPQMILPIHGRLPTREELPYCELLIETPILYGDEAPNYEFAMEILEKLQFGDTLLVIGVSNYTSVSNEIRVKAMSRGASIVEIHDSAETKVRQFLERRRDEWIL